MNECLWERGNPNEGESHAAVTWGRVEGDSRVKIGRGTVHADPNMG